MSGPGSCGPIIMPASYANYEDCIHTGSANANHGDKTGVVSAKCIKNDKGVSIPKGNGFVQDFTPDGTNGN